MTSVARVEEEIYLREKQNKHNTIDPILPYYIILYTYAEEKKNNMLSGYILNHFGEYRVSKYLIIIKYLIV